MANLKDIAAHTGLSIATVSKHINGIKINQENAVRIDMAVQELGYRVNYIARGLKKNKSMTIGVLLHELENIFAASIISKIENDILPHGYSTIICDCKSDAAIERQKLSFLLDKMVDALVILPSHLTKEDLSGISIPVVMIDRKIQGAELDYILTDNEEASKTATEHLISCGHKDIAIICGPEEVYTAEKRLGGYKKAMSLHNIPIKEQNIYHGKYDIDSGYGIMQKIIKTNVSAVHVTNYEMTLGAIIAINEAGGQIPKDISIIGFDNMHMARVVNPPLSIISQPIEGIGEAAAQILLKRLSGDHSEKQTVVLKSQFIMQKSVQKMK